MKSELAGRIALVTGASRGIGRAIAIALAGAGADVVVNYRSNEEEARKVCQEIENLGRRGIAVQADVGRTTSVAGLVEKVQRALGTVAILVNNAGVGGRRTIEEITEEDWDEMLAVNLKAAFLTTQAVLPAMRTAGWGRIINISSVAAQMGGVVGPHYAASKAGILGLTR